MNETLTAVLIELGLYALLTITYTVLSAWKNINIWGVKWDWRLWSNGAVKYGLVGLSVLAVAFSAYVVVNVLAQYGIIFEGVQAYSPAILIGVLAAAIAPLVLKNFQAIAKVFSVTEQQLADLAKSVEKSESSSTGESVTVAPATIDGVQDSEVVEVK